MPATLLPALISTDTQFRMSILERLEQMEQRMAEISNQNPNSESIATKGSGLEGGGTSDHQSQVMNIQLAWVKGVQVEHRSSQVSPDQDSFESRVLIVCEKMMSQSCWASSSQLIHNKNSRGMTLLHLAAAQGYAGLLRTLIHWR